MVKDIDERTVMVQVFSTFALALLFTVMFYFAYGDMPVGWWDNTRNLGWSFETLFLFNIATCSAPALIIAMLYDSRVNWDSRVYWNE